jgi:integrase
VDLVESSGDVGLRGGAGGGLALVRGDRKWEREQDFDRRRLVPLSRPARAALREWLADRAAHPSGPDIAHGAVWISRTGEQISVMVRAGIDESAHALRHTVATRLARECGRDLALVVDFLDHADLKTTRHYVRSDLEDRRAALEELAG